MTATRYAGPPMTLANMRGLGVRSISATCECGRSSIVDVSALPDDVAVPGLRSRLRWSACGNRPMDVRPDWSQSGCSRRESAEERH